MMGPDEKGLICYETESNPTKVGVYACRVDDDYSSDLKKDIFLMWFDGKWGYLGSDQKYRSKVQGWIGPLKRSL